MEWAQILIPLAVGMVSASIGAFVGVRVGMVRLQEQFKAALAMISEMEKRILLKADLFQAGTQERIAVHERRIDRLETHVFKLPKAE